MPSPLNQAALDQLFLTAHTHNAWQSRPVPDELLHRLYNLFRMGPTSANCCPARIVFVKSMEAKEQLQPALAEGNRAKSMAAPVTAIIGYDMKFYEKWSNCFPTHKECAAGSTRTNRLPSPMRFATAPCRELT